MGELHRLLVTGEVSVAHFKVLALELVEAILLERAARATIRDAEALLREDD